MSATAPSTPARTFPLWRFLGRSLLVLLGVALLGVLVVSAWFYRAAVSSLPQMDGELHLAGLSAPVTVVRDAQGVPHITAANLDDLAFAQGYVTAQDRLWQMDVNRRFGRGELSEIFGERTLRVDRRQRILQLRRVSESAVQKLPAEDRRLLEAYTRGINALIASQKDLPIEFRILRYAPRPWTLEDSVTVGVNIAQSLSTQYDTEYAREQVARKLGPELAADLYVNGSYRDRWPGSLPPSGPVSVPAESAHEQSVAELLDSLPIPCDSCTPGSNNWVVSGAHTASGKPLLSNDMHLAHSIPGIWYEVHLRAAGLDVAGVSFPGLPFVVAGHNQRIAWGYTNLGPDVQDLFIEEFNAQGEYKTPAGWRKPDFQRETIHVKGSPDVQLDVAVTRHGPIVTDLFPGETRKLALQWTIYDPQTIQFNFRAMNSARDWPGFLAAINGFGGATQNIVYADVDGNIGYHAAGWIPVRASGDGTLPVSGADASQDWTGYVPFDKLPAVFNPPSGIIATANARVTPDGYPLMLANQWGSPFRTERIYSVLESGKWFTAADMLDLQMDTFSAFDLLVAQALVAAVDNTPGAGGRVKHAADLMRDWNGRVDVDAVAPTMAAKTRRKLWQMLLEPRLGAAWEDYQWFSSSVALEDLLHDRPARWLPKGFKDWDGLLMAALDATVADRSAPADLASWKWGPAFPISLQHPVLGSIPVVSRWSGPGEHPQSGNGSLTVKAAGRGFGASQRATYDLSNLDASTLNVVCGESGQIFSPHYMDQWPAWYGGTSFVLPFSSASVDRAAAHTLRLLPASR
ncbi:MAG: penicillin acylase family protein [Acidobacteriales bacterium]|nr:penicillin acylase family protein [Terriglobales bacterium]